MILTIPKVNRPVEFTKAQPLLRPDARGEKWTVEEDFIWYFGEKYSGRFIIVPKGFVTDLASVPKPLRLIVSHTTAPASSVVHDYNYRYPSIYNFVGRDGNGDATHTLESLTRKQIDQNYRDMLIVLDTPKWKANTMYYGVRAGGWRPYNKYRKADRLAA